MKCIIYVDQLVHENVLQTYSTNLLLLYLSCIVFLSQVIQGIVAPGGQSKMCRHCNHVTSPDDCTVLQVCHEEVGYITF